MKLLHLLESEGHTCPLRYRKPDDDRWAARNRKSCKVCNKEYESELDVGFDDEPVSDEPAPRKLKKEVNRPRNVDELRSFVKAWSEPWEVAENPGDLFSGDACPECGKILKNKRKFIGAPKFIGCANNHAFVIQDRPEKVRKDLGPPKPLPPEKGAGRFGTGRPAKIKDDDSTLVKLLKTLRDTGGNRWSRRGEGGGRRIREKENCVAGHNCPPSPTGKDRDYPVIKDRELYDSITGAPKDEYRDYYLDKMRCPVCRGDLPRCPNKVSSEFGKAKLYCSDHLEENPYIQDVKKRVAGAPDPNADYRETEALWKRVRGKLLQVGDKVKMGKSVGTLIGVDGKMEDGRTHVVRWKNPRTAALEVTYNNPEKLDLNY